LVVSGSATLLRLIVAPHRIRHRLSPRPVGFQPLLGLVQSIGHPLEQAETIKELIGVAY